MIRENKSFNNNSCSELETAAGEFENCSFTQCDFSNRLFTASVFIDCIFANCNLTMVKLTDCLLNGILFKNCKVLGVNFSDCVDMPFDVKFEGCILDYCLFVRKKMLKTAFIDSSLRNADFSECDLTKSVFANADLMNVVFNRTILKEADFLTAKNFIIDPELNLIKKAKFSIYGAVGLLNKYDIVIEQ